MMVALSAAGCADSTLDASLAPVAAAEAPAPTLVSATSCEEAEAAVRAQAKMSLRLETARLRRATLDGRLLPGASPPARARAPSSPTGGLIGAAPRPGAPGALGARVGRVAVVTDRVYAVTRHGLHVASREAGAGLATGRPPSFVPITGEAWGVVAAGAWALVLSSVSPEPGEGAPHPGQERPRDAVVLTRVDASELDAPRIVYEEALDGHVVMARAAGGAVTLVVGAPWAVSGTSTAPEGLSPDASEAEVLAAFDALDARNDAAVEAAPLPSLMPQRRGVLWSGALDPSGTRPAARCATLFYPAALAGGGGASAAGDGTAAVGLSVGAAITYVVTAAVAPGPGPQEARVLGALVGDWRYPVWGDGGGALAAVAERLDGGRGLVAGREAGALTPADAGERTLVVRLASAADASGEPAGLRLDAVSVVDGGPLAEGALAGLEGGRLLVATRRPDAGARLTVLSVGAGEGGREPPPLSVWAAWDVDGVHGGASVVYTDGARAYVQPADPWGAVATLALDEPGAAVRWVEAGSGCAWVGLVPQRGGRLVALRRCGEDGARLSWASFLAEGEEAVVTGVGVDDEGLDDQDWTDVIWGQQSIWPLDAVGLIGVPVTTRVVEDGGWTSVRPALALFRSWDGGVEPAGLIAHPAPGAPASARMADARQRDGWLWTVSAAGLGATSVAALPQGSLAPEGDVGGAGAGTCAFVAWDCL